MADVCCMLDCHIVMCFGLAAYLVAIACSHRFLCASAAGLSICACSTAELVAFTCFMSRRILYCTDYGVSDCQLGVSHWRGWTLFYMGMDYTHHRRHTHHHVGSKGDCFRSASASLNGLLRFCLSFLCKALLNWLSPRDICCSIVLLTKVLSQSE